MEGLSLFMAIFLHTDIFNKIERFADFADIVIIGRHPGEQRIGADGFGRRLGQVADNNGMVIGTWSLYHQFAQHRGIHIGKFQQLDIGRIFEQGFHQRHQAGDQQRAKEATGKTKASLIKHLDIETAPRNELRGQHHTNIGQRQTPTGLIQAGPLGTVTHPVSPL